MTDWRAYIEEKHGWLLTICRSVTRDPDKAHDAMSEVVVEWLPGILERWDATLDESKRAPLDIWVRYNIRWKVFQWLHKNDRRPGTLSLDFYDDGWSGAPINDPAMRVPPEHLRLEEIEACRVAFSKLDAPDRDLLVMHAVMGLTMREIAERCGWALGTVHARIADAKARMKEKLP